MVFREMNRPGEVSDSQQGNPLFDFTQSMSAHAFSYLQETREWRNHSSESKFVRLYAQTMAHSLRYLLINQQPLLESLYELTGGEDHNPHILADIMGYYAFHSTAQLLGNECPDIAASFIEEFGATSYHDPTRDAVNAFIDPLDGSKNFLKYVLSKGKDGFIQASAITLTRSIDGKPIAGAIISLTDNRTVLYDEHMTEFIHIHTKHNVPFTFAMLGRHGNEQAAQFIATLPADAQYIDTFGGYQLLEMIEHKTHLMFDFKGQKMYEAFQWKTFAEKFGLFVHLPRNEDAQLMRAFAMDPSQNSQHRVQILIAQPNTHFALPFAV